MILSSCVRACFKSSCQTLPVPARLGGRSLLPRSRSNLPLLKTPGRLLSPPPGCSGARSSVMGSSLPSRGLLAAVPETPTHTYPPWPRTFVQCTRLFPKFSFVLSVLSCVRLSRDQALSSLQVTYLSPCLLMTSMPQTPAVLTQEPLHTSHRT